MPHAGPRAASAVSWAEHLLTRLALGHPGFWTRLGNLEAESLRPRLEAVDIRQPIYITGLPRAGSTILLNILATVPGVATHRSRDFPFLFTPCWHNRLLASRDRPDVPLVERAHADGILVGPGSPEAMEEILWMPFFPRLHDPAVSNVLAAGGANPAFVGFYGDHLRKLLLIRSARRYLAKNNYHVTRMRYLLEIFPAARFVLLVRDPVAHVASLVKQQRLFSTRYREDRRALHRLRALGHFEFGEVRRPINPGDPEGTRAVIDRWERGREVEGWSWYWRVVYAHLTRLLAGDDAVREATLVVRFESLCNSPAETLAAIARHCGLAGATEALRAAAPTLRFPTYYRIAFTPEELAVIRSTTAEVAAGFGYG